MAPLRNRQVPRWTIVIAHIIPLLVLPSALWRLGVVAGIGIEGSACVIQPWEYIYIPLLSIVSEGLALLSLGLVRPWGEVLPRWLPLIGRRRVPVLAATIAAGLGACSLMLLSVYALTAPPAPADAACILPSSGWSGIVFQICYLPLLAWGPLLLMLAAAYYRRCQR